MFDGTWIEDAIEQNIPHNERFELLKSAENPPRDQASSTGYVPDTLGAALWCACNIGNYEKYLLKAVNACSASDTTARVSGVLVGAMNGYELISWI